MNFAIFAALRENFRQLVTNTSSHERSLAGRLKIVLLRREPSTATETSRAEARSGAPAASPRTRARIRTRPLLIGLVVIVLIGVAARFGYNYWLDTITYISTDDALVDANMTTVMTTGSGVLAVWRAKIGDRVRAGQVIGLVRPAPGATAGVSFEVTAPINGTLVRVDGKEGQIISAAQPIAYGAD